jgi:hypothetical protein
VKAQFQYTDIDHGSASATWMMISVTSRKRSMNVLPLAFHSSSGLAETTGIYFHFTGEIHP